MVWVAYQIRYRDSDGERKWLTLGRYTKRRFDDYQSAFNHMISLDQGWRHKHDPRIVAVRLKPRVVRDEATIRREERERIAAALKIGDDGYVLEPVSFHGSTQFLRTKTAGITGLEQMREAILDFDWKPEPK